MKILIATEYFPEVKGKLTGGVEARAFFLAEEISKKHEVLVLTSWQKGQERNSNIGDINIKRVGPNHDYSNSGSFTSRFRFAIALKNAISKEKYDVVDSFNFTTYIPGYFGARKSGAKAVATYHETWIGEWIKNKGIITGSAGYIIERITLKLNWDLIIPVSNFTKNKLRQAGIPSDKMQVVYNGVEKVSLPRQKKNKIFTIATIARLVKTKQIQTLIKSISHLDDVNAVIVGTGPYKEELVKISKNLKVEKRVRFTGFLKSKIEVLKELNSADAFCLPSAVEGFGITVVEAMECGIPVITSNIPPLVEITQNGKSGLNFELGNDKDLAYKIQQLKDNKLLRKKLISSGLDRAKDFNWKNIAKRYLKILQISI